MDLRDVVLFAILIGSVPVIFWRPWFGVLMWYWVGLMNPHRLTWGFMYDFPAAMLVGATTLVAFIIAQDRRPPPFVRESVFLVLMIAWFTLTTIYAWVPSMAWDYWEQAMKVLGFTLLATMLVHGRKRTEWLLIVITGSLAFYGVKGGLFVLSTGGQHRVLGPPQSFIGGNTSLGLAMLMVMPLILVLARQARSGGLVCIPDWKRTKWAGWLGYGAFWLTGIATVFTYSRGALLGLAAIAPFIFLKMRYKPLLLVLALAAGSTVLALVPDQLIDRAETIENYEEDRSAMQRIQAWGVNLNIALEHPLGGGFNLTYIDDATWLSYANFLGDWANESRVAHSNYFQVLGQHGFFGLALYLGLLLSILTSLLQMSLRGRAQPETVWIADYAWALFVGTVAYAVAGAFLNLAYFTLFYAFVAAVIVLRREYNLALTTHKDRGSPALQVTKSFENPGLQYSEASTKACQDRL